MDVRCLKTAGRRRASGAERFGIDEQERGVGRCLTICGIIDAGWCGAILAYTEKRVGEGAGYVEIGKWEL
jgi:hypothetical protein